MGDSAPSPPLEYVIDADDRIRSVNAAWSKFALGNRGEALLPPTILGSLLWDWIADQETVHLYRGLMRGVRASRRPVAFRIRCDSPERRRLLDLRIRPGEGGDVVFTTALLEAKERPALAVLDTEAPRSDALLRLCAWCMRVPDADEHWIELEDALQELGLFTQPRPPRLTHGICPRCRDEIVSMMLREHRGAGTSGSSPIGPTGPRR